MPDLINGKFVYEPDPDEPTPRQEEREKCPCCGSSWPEILYVDDWGIVVGCNDCITPRYVD